jgi:hypothetical protein
MGERGPRRPGRSPPGDLTDRPSGQAPSRGVTESRRARCAGPGVQEGGSVPPSLDSQAIRYEPTHISNGMVRRLIGRARAPTVACPESDDPRILRKVHNRFQPRIRYRRVSRPNRDRARQDDRGPGGLTDGTGAPGIVRQDASVSSDRCAQRGLAGPHKSSSEPSIPRPHRGVRPRARWPGAGPPSVANSQDRSQGIEFDTIWALPQSRYRWRIPARRRSAGDGARWAPPGAVIRSLRCPERIRQRYRDCRRSRSAARPTAGMNRRRAAHSLQVGESARPKV